jgi:hypothetical protein
MRSAAALQLTTLAGCGLAIGGYPRFGYNASGGGGTGRLEPPDDAGRQALGFDPQQLQIPPLDGRSTRLLGLPLPPGLSIAIVPEQLAGHWQPASGQLQLRFRARFRFRLGGLYQAPDLRIDTELSTEPLQSRRHRVAGRRLDGQGEALLVGVALVPPSGDPWLDRFLGLPDEALALLRCRLQACRP